LIYLDLCFDLSLYQSFSFLSRFRTAYRAFPDVFRVWDKKSIGEVVECGKQRLVRQILFLSSLFWHCVMLVFAEAAALDGSAGRASGARIKDADVRGIREAAHEAIRAFFVRGEMLQGEEACGGYFATGLFQRL
jgi:hypothetical protein